MYNTSSYDGLSSLEIMDGLVDIYLADFKFWTNETSFKLAKCKNYPEVARNAIKEMFRQVGDLVFDESGLAKQGLILRHLVMPGLEDEAKLILDWVVSEISKDTYMNLMEQYHPDFKGSKNGFYNFISHWYLLICYFSVIMEFLLPNEALRGHGNKFFEIPNKIDIASGFGAP